MIARLSTTSSNVTASVQRRHSYAEYLEYFESLDCHAFSATEYACHWSADNDDWREVTADCFDTLARPILVRTRLCMSHYFSGWRTMHNSIGMWLTIPIGWLKHFVVYWNIQSSFCQHCVSEGHFHKFRLTDRWCSKVANWWTWAFCLAPFEFLVSLLIL